MAKVSMTQTEVLTFLKDKLPAIHADAEIERDWVWVTTNLRALPASRKALKEVGFRWAKKGHPLSSGKTGTWGHSCKKPIPFFKRGSKTKGSPKTVKEMSNDDLIKSVLG